MADKPPLTTTIPNCDDHMAGNSLFTDVEFDNAVEKESPRDALEENMKKRTRTLPEEPTMQPAHEKEKSKVSFADKLKGVAPPFNSSGLGGYDPL